MLKGNLIRYILYSVEVDSKFAKESARFMIILATICLIGFLSILPSKISGINEIEDKIERTEAYLYLLQFLNLITTTVPPSFPCCLGIGIAQRSL